MNIEIRNLLDGLHNLLCDEDLTDEKLREASEGLLPRLADALTAEKRLNGISVAITKAALDIAAVHGVSAYEAMNLLKKSMATVEDIESNDGTAIDMGRQEFVIVMDGSPWRIEYAAYDEDGQWWRRCLDEDVVGIPIPISDPVALALLELPVFDLVKADGSVVEDHGHGEAGGE